MKQEIPGISSGCPADPAGVHNRAVRLACSDRDGIRRHFAEQTGAGVVGDHGEWNFGRSRQILVTAQRHGQRAVRHQPEILVDVSAEHQIDLRCIGGDGLDQTKRHIAVIRIAEQRNVDQRHPETGGTPEFRAGKIGQESGFFTRHFGIAVDPLPRFVGMIVAGIQCRIANLSLTEGIPGPPGIMADERVIRRKQTDLFMIAADKDQRFFFGIELL